MRAAPEVMAALDEASKGVQAASTELSRLIASFYEAAFDPDTGEIHEGVGLRFDLAMKAELRRLYQEAIRDGSRPPASDVREAMAAEGVRSTDPSLWAEYHSTNARIEALRSWIGNQKAAISANQSVLRGERE